MTRASQDEKAGQMCMGGLRVLCRRRTASATMVAAAIDSEAPAARLAVALTGVALEVRAALAHYLEPRYTNKLFPVISAAQPPSTASPPHLCCRRNRAPPLPAAPCLFTTHASQSARNGAHPLIPATSERTNTAQHSPVHKVQPLYGAAPPSATLAPCRHAPRPPSPTAAISCVSLPLSV